MKTPQNDRDKQILSLTTHIIGQPITTSNTTRVVFNISDDLDILLDFEFKIIDVRGDSVKLDMKTVFALFGLSHAFKGWSYEENFDWELLEEMNNDEDKLEQN